MAQTSALAEGVRGHEVVTRPDVLTGTKSETCGRALVQLHLLHWLQVMGRSTGARVRTSALLVCLLLMGLSAAQSKLLVPSRPVVVPPGSDVTLPCGLDSAVDVTAETLEWTRPDLSPRFVLVWRSGQEFVNIKNPAFAGRTALFADELKTGNLSLKLSSVAVADEGTYKCFVPDKSEEAFVELVVAVAASPVVSLSGLDRDRGAVVLECRSGGWFPEPELLWLDAEGKLLSAGPTETVRGSDDLYTVSSRVTVDKRHSSRYTCRVQQTSINHTSEAHIHVPDDFFNFPSSSCAATVGLSIALAFCIISILLLVLFLLRIKNIINSKRRCLINGNFGRRKKSKMNNERKPLKSSKKLKDQQRMEETEKRTMILRAELETKKKEVKQTQAELQELQKEKERREKVLKTVKDKLDELNNESSKVKKKKNNKKEDTKTDIDLLKTELENQEKLLQDKIKEFVNKEDEMFVLLQDVIDMMEMNLPMMVENQETNSDELRTYTQLQQQQRRGKVETTVKSLTEKLETKRKEIQTELLQLQKDKEDRKNIVQSFKKILDERNNKVEDNRAELQQQIGRGENGLENLKKAQTVELIKLDLENKEIKLQSIVKQFEMKEAESNLLREMIEMMESSLQMMGNQQTHIIKMPTSSHITGDGGNTAHLTV